MDRDQLPKTLVRRTCDPDDASHDLFLDDRLPRGLATASASGTCTTFSPGYISLAHPIHDLSRGYTETFGITKGIILSYRGPVRAPRAKRDDARTVAFPDRS
jgi:hypothetical protein